MNEEKESFDILNSNNPEKIKEFEDKFQQINNYFEQYEAFKKFVETDDLKLVPEDLKVSVLVHDKEKPIDAAFQRTVSDNLDEFDCILHLIYSFISVLADAALSLVAQCL